MTLKNSDDVGKLSPHELCVVLAALECGLNDTLVEMLGEHFAHHTERRGCGFTQATRHLAELVNQPLGERSAVIGKLFPAWAKAALRQQVSTALEGEDGGDLQPLHQVLAELPSKLEREESRLLAGIIADLVRPQGAAHSPHELPPCYDELKVGTCTLAERFFLEIGHGYVRRAGSINVHISDSGEPLLIEKVNLGDNHSCISVADVRLNGIRLPPGSLFAVRRDDDLGIRPCAALRGQVLRARDCGGYRFLRLATLAVTPAHRRRAFSVHFQAQIEACLFSPGETTIEQLRQVALEQL